MKNFILTITHLPICFFIIYLISIFFYKKNFFRKIILINTFFLIFFLFPVTSYYLEKPFYPKKNIYEKNKNINYSLILVPASGFRKDHKNKIYLSLPSSTSIKRLKNAVKFTNYLDLPIFVSGGKTINYLDSEAKVLLKYSLKNFEIKQIILDEDSLNSYETAINLYKYINKKKMNKNIILITDLYHFKRMSGTLKKNKINSYIPNKLYEKKNLKKKDFIPTRANWSEINAIRYAYFGIIYYIIFNKMDINSL